MRTGNTLRPGAGRPDGSGAKAAVVLFTVGLLVAGCSSGRGGRSTAVRGHHSEPATTRHAPTTSTSTTTTTTMPPQATATVTLQVPSSLAGGTFTTTHQLDVPAGWTAQLWALVPAARFEAWTPQGALLVSQPDDGKITELTPAATTAAASTAATAATAAGPPAAHIVLSGLTYPQGLAFGRYDGRTVLYVGESDQIDRYAWSASGPGAKTVIAADLPDLDSSGDDVHRPKDVVVAPDGDVYFDVGSSSNANPDDRTMTPPRAVIMSVHPDGTDLQVVETGVRNGEGLSVAPDGSVWTAVNERDNIPYPSHGPYGGYSDAFGQVVQSYVDEHPPDEVSRVVTGRELGWPYCDPDPDLSSPAGSLTNVPFIANALTNPNDQHMDCSTLQPLEVALPAHSAPLGFHFLEGTKIAPPWSDGAVVAVHGSWDRQPPRAPAVMWMSWTTGTGTTTTTGTGTGTLGAAVTLVGGFQNADGSRWGRPVDAVAGPDGSLYVSDDQAGAIYRLTPPNS